MNWNEIFKNTATEISAEEQGTDEKIDAAAVDAAVDVRAENANASADLLPGEAEAPVESGNYGTLRDTPVHMRITGTGDAAKAALYLALSNDISEERRIKEALQEIGWRSVATEVGGISGELSMKVSRALVGAALNSGVVRKSAAEMHALLHAAQEAFNSFIPFGLLETSIGAKIAIVRNAQWIAVAVAGDTAFHAIAHHERMGVGVMHV